MSSQDTHPSTTLAFNETVNKAGDDPSIDGPLAGLNANASPFTPSNINVAQPLVVTTKGEDIHTASTDTDMAMVADPSSSIEPANVGTTRTLSGDAVVFEPAKAAMRTPIAGNTTVVLPPTGPTGPSIAAVAYDGRASGPISMDPFFFQVPTGPRRQPVPPRSKPVPRSASTYIPPFVNQVPTDLLATGLLLPKKHADNVQFNDHNDPREQPISPWWYSALPVTSSPNDLAFDQVSSQQYRPVFDWSKTASPLTKEATRSSKDLVGDQLTSPQYRPVLDWSKASSPLTEVDTEQSTPITRHQRLTSSPWNTKTSVATTTTPPSNPNINHNRPLLCVKTSLPKSPTPLDQPLQTVPRTNFKTTFTGRAAGGPQTSIPNPRPSHTNSKTWTNPRTALQERWLGIEKRLQKMEFIPTPDKKGIYDRKHSPFVPQSFEEYLEHCTLFKQDRLNERKRRLVALERAAVRDPRLPPPGPRVRIGPAFGGKQFHDNRSSVLAQYTVYSSWYEPRGRPEAQWPCPQEMAEEGDERYTSKFKRMTAVPRDPCNETVSYKQRPFIHPLLLDSIWGSPWRIPTLKKVEKMRRLDNEMRGEKEVGEALIGQSLLDAIDCIGDDE